MRSFLVKGCNMATSFSCVVSLTEMSEVTDKDRLTTRVDSRELQATVTPPSSESENLMRNVPTSLVLRNSSASCRETKPSRALNKMC